MRLASQKRVTSFNQNKKRNRLTSTSHTRLGNSSLSVQLLVASLNDSHKRCCFDVVLILAWNSVHFLEQIYYESFIRKMLHFTTARNADTSPTQSANFTANLAQYLSTGSNLWPDQLWKLHYGHTHWSAGTTTAQKEVLHLHKDILLKIKKRIWFIIYSFHFWYFCINKK